MDASLKLANHRRMERKLAKKHTVAVCRKGMSGLGPNLALSVVDLSVDGTQLIVKTALKRGEEVEVTLSSSGVSEPIKCDGIVAWCAPMDETRNRAGIKFDNSLDYADLYHLT